jgi:hypothetical protein
MAGGRRCLAELVLALQQGWLPAAATRAYDATAAADARHKRPERIEFDPVFKETTS